MEILQALLVEIGVAGAAVFAPSAVGVHGVLKVHNDFEAVVLEAGDGFPGHQEVLFRRGFERLHDVEQAGLDHQDGHGNALFVAHDELHIGPILDSGAATPRSAKEGQLHGSGAGRVERGGQVSDELIGAGKADLRVAHAKSSHALQ